MPASGQYRYDFAGSINVAVGAASATAALPANRELFAVSADCNARFRFSTLAQATAVATDPLITANAGTLIIRINPGVEVNVSVIGDPAAPNTGLLSIAPVFED